MNQVYKAGQVWIDVDSARMIIKVVGTQILYLHIRNIHQTYCNQLSAETFAGLVAETGATCLP